MRGLDEPDHRCRYGLDRVGIDLAVNPDITVTAVELLASGWHILRKSTFEHRHADGSVTTEQRDRRREDHQAVAVGRPQGTVPSARGTQPARVRATIGMTRSVFSWYSAKPGFVLLNFA